MPNPIRRISLTFIMFFIAASMRAQDGDALPSYAIKDSVLVVASRYALPLNRETNTIHRIDGVDVRRMADHNALELLRWSVPSAYIVQSRVGGFGVGSYGTGAVYMRGMGGKPNTGVAMMIDGHPDFMGIFGHPLPDVYGMEDVDHVDVLLGPSSTVFGGNALGGVINIVSASARRDQFRLSLEGGSWGTYNSSLGISRVFGNHGIMITLARNGSDGHIDKTDFRASRVQAGWDWLMTPGWELSVRGRFTPMRFDDPSRSADPAGLGTWGDIERGMGQLIVRNTAGVLTGSTQAYVNTGHHKFADGFVSDDHAWGFSTYQQWTISSLASVAAGVDAISYGGTTTADNKSYALDTYGAYVLAMYSPLRMLHVRAGVRVQEHSVSGGAIAPSAGIGLTPLSGLRLYANLQSGFRQPTTRELYMYAPANIALTEERSSGYEVGAEYLAHGAMLRVAAFRTEATDMIVTAANPTPPPPMKLQNIGEAKISGLEATARYTFSHHLFVQASWSSLDAGELTAYNPSGQFKYWLAGTLGSFQLTLAGQYVRDLYAGNKAAQKLPDYHVLDAVLQWDSPWNISLFVKARNILDRSYQVLPNYSAPGAHFLTGIRWTHD